MRLVFQFLGKGGESDFYGARPPQAHGRGRGKAKRSKSPGGKDRRVGKGRGLWTKKKKGPKRSMKIERCCDYKIGCFISAGGGTEWGGVDKINVAWKELGFGGGTRKNGRQSIFEGFHKRF